MPSLPLKINANYQPLFLTSTKKLYEPLTKKMMKRADKILKLFNENTNPANALFATYLQQVKNGKVEIQYKRKRNGFGRSFTGEGVINWTLLKRSLRNTLLNGEVLDFDLKNAHYCLLLNICLSNDIKCDNLKTLVDTRENLVAELMETYSVSKKIVKTLFASLLFGGTIDNWLIDNGLPAEIPVPPFWDNLRREVNEITATIKEANLACFKSLLSETGETFWNENGKFLANYLQHQEFVVVDKAMRFVALEGGFDYQITSSKGKKKVCQTFQSGSYELDGFKLMAKSVPNPPQLLDDINTHIRNVFGSYITFDLKPLDEVEDLGIFEGEEEEEEEEEAGEEARGRERVVEQGVDNDLEASQKVFELYPNIKFCQGSLWMFDGDDGMWKCDKATHRKVISSLADNLHLLETRADGSVLKSRKSYGSTLTLMDKIPPLLETIANCPYWLDEKANSSLGYLLFNNGYLHLTEEGMLFYSKEERGFNPDIVFYGKIHKDFILPTEAVKKYAEDIKQRLFVAPLGKAVAEYALLYYARAIVGMKDKSILFNLGATNAGKSLIASAFRKTFGSQIVGAFNAENFVFRNSNGDEAKDNRWSLLLRNHRLLFSNELKMGQPLDGNLLKKHSAGLDTLSGRVHSGNETDYLPHYGLVFSSNDLPDIRPLEDGGRFKFITYTKSFVDNPTNEFELEKDPNLEDEIETEEFQQAFITLILTAFNTYPKEVPEEMLENKKDWVGANEGDTTDFGMFLADFDLTDKAEDFVSSKEVESWLSVKKLGVSYKKLVLEIKKQAKLRRCANVDKKRQTVGGKQVMGWVGLKFVEKEVAVNTASL
jgi:hypothetical protein